MVPEGADGPQFYVVSVIARQNYLVVDTFLVEYSLEGWQGFIVEAHV